MSNVVLLTIANQNYELSIKEYQGQRVVTFKDIDRLHQRPEGTAGRNFRENRKHFIENEDFFELNQPDEIRCLGLERPQGGVPAKVILLTESGYLMLVKSLTDDLAWQVQRQLVNHYFRAKGSIQMPTTPIEALLQTVQILAEQEKQIKALAAAREEDRQKLEVLSHRVDNMDAVDTIGDLRQRLNRMVQKYARQKGILFSTAWSDFKQAYNTAYRTNLELLILNFEKKHGLKNVTIPQYLSAKGKLEDGIRVADKLLNQQQVV